MLRVQPRPVTMAPKAQLLELPTEIRIKIYELLLLPKPREATRINTNWIIKGYLSPQILRVSQQIHSECLPILYGNIRFECPSSAGGSGIESLLEEVGARNFAYIKYLIVNWDDMPRISSAVRNESTAGLYRSLETLEISKRFTIDLSRSEPDIHPELVQIRKVCQSAREIARQHGSLCVIAQSPPIYFSLPGRFLRAAPIFHLSLRLLRSNSAMQRTVRRVRQRSPPISASIY